MPTTMFSAARWPILFSESATVLNDVHETKVIKRAYPKVQKIHKYRKTHRTRQSLFVFELILIGLIERCSIIEEGLLTTEVQVQLFITPKMRNLFKWPLFPFLPSCK